MLKVMLIRLEVKITPYTFLRTEENSNPGRWINDLVRTLPFRSPTAICQVPEFSG